jgi:hypothetical protein
VGERLADAEVDKLFSDPKVIEAMRLRCEEDGHKWCNGCTVFFQVTTFCQWCGYRR